MGSEKITIGDEGASINDSQSLSDLETDILMDLSTYYSDCGRDLDAHRIALTVTKRQIEVLPTNHTNVLVALGRLSETTWRLNRDPVLVGLMRSAILHAYEEKPEVYKGAYHYRAVGSRLSYADILAERHPEPALAIMQDVAAGQARVHKTSNHPEVVYTKEKIVHLARSMTSLNARQLAYTTQQSIMQSREDGITLSERLTSESVLADCYYSLGKHKQAKMLHEQLVGGLTRAGQRADQRADKRAVPISKESWEQEQRLLQLLDIKYSLARDLFRLFDDNCRCTGPMDQCSARSSNMGEAVNSSLNFHGKSVKVSRLSSRDTAGSKFHSALGSLNGLAATQGTRDTVPTRGGQSYQDTRSGELSPIKDSGGPRPVVATTNSVSAGTAKSGSDEWPDENRLYLRNPSILKVKLEKRSHLSAAVKLLKEVVEGREKILGSRHKLTLEAMERLHFALAFSDRRANAQEIKELRGHIDDTLARTTQMLPNHSESTTKRVTAWIEAIERATRRQPEDSKARNGDSNIESLKTDAAYAWVKEEFADPPELLPDVTIVGTMSREESDLLKDADAETWKHQKREWDQEKQEVTLRWKWLVDGI